MKKRELETPPSPFHMSFHFKALTINEFICDVIRARNLSTNSSTENYFEGVSRLPALRSRQLFNQSENRMWRLWVHFENRGSEYNFDSSQPLPIPFVSDSRCWGIPVLSEGKARGSTYFVGNENSRRLFQLPFSEVPVTGLWLLVFKHLWRPINKKEGGRNAPMPLLFHQICRQDVTIWEKRFSVFETLITYRALAYMLKNE